MAGETWTQASWMNEMESASKKSPFLTFDVTDSKTLEILSDPVKGVSKFKWPDGSPKTEFKLSVRVEGADPTPVPWAITNKDIMQQILGIMRANMLHSLVGCRIQVNCRGADKTRRSWFMVLLSKPGGQPVQQVAPAPVAPQQQQADQGQTWLQGQMQGMAPAGGK